MPYISTLLIVLSIVLSSCSGGSGGSIGGGGNPVPTPPGETVPNPPDPGEEETVVIGAPGLCDFGDIARVGVSAAGSARFSLVSENHPCSPVKDNRLEEYSMILFNTSESPISFRLDSPSALNPFGFSNSSQSSSSYSFDKPAVLNVEPKDYGKGPLDTALYASTLPKINKQGNGLNNSLSNALTVNYSVGDEVEFRVLNSIDDENSFITTSAVLRAQGTHINLFIDRDVPFNVIGNVDSPIQQHVDHAVEIFDNNIHPLITNLLGQESDVDGDGRVNILITPILNRDTEAASYVDSRNAMAYNPITNPMSNETELIVMYAPDSQSNYAATGNFVDANEYFKEKVFNGWAAFQLPKLISYNQKVLINGAVPEDDWIDDGVGAVMADLTGFNLFRRAAWRYLAAPQLDDLRKTELFEFRSGQGAEYLFMLYYIQANLDDTLVDADLDGFDDDLDFLSNVYASAVSGPQNLVEFVDVLFDPEIESEFDGLFKDWVIALLTSGSGQTVLQQTNQNVLKYYLNENPLVLGSQINNASGSVRAGADGVTTGLDGGLLDGDAQQNSVGLDLHALNTETNILFENADEYVYAPGNSMNGYIDPFSAMYVRVSGLLTSEQEIGLFSSSTLLRGFLVRRPDLSYPKTYHESIFGAINQLPEDLDEIGPNPFWEIQGPVANAKRINLGGMIQSNPTVNETSEDYISIVGKIDQSQEIFVCPEAFEDCDFEEVQDTDKYIFTVPDLGRGDENYLSISVRRRFDAGLDSSALNPLLAIVSSKDVPYPYVPHPIRNAVNDDLGGPGTTDTRQQYRWLTSKLICGDDQNITGDGTMLATNTGTDCVPRDAEDSLKITLSEEGGFIENTGSLTTTSGAWDGDITGGQCDLPAVGFGAQASYGSHGAYGVTNVETSGSSLGSYPWGSASDSFMRVSYNGTQYPKAMFDREFIKVSPDYPSIGEEGNPPYDPRVINTPTLNCHIQTGGEIDLEPDSPDDFISYEELESKAVTTLSEQILSEMSRFRKSSSGLDENVVLDPKYDTPDVFVIDGDSRDLDDNCSTSDLTNNMNTYTVRGGGEGSILMGEENFIVPHISGNLNAVASAGFTGQTIYDNDGGETILKLVPGKSYTLIVGGENGSVGDYEIRIRKTSDANKRFGTLKDFDADNVCFFVR